MAQLNIVTKSSTFCLMFAYKYIPRCKCVELCGCFCRLNVEDSGEDENSEHKTSKESTESVSTLCLKKCTYFETV